MCTLDHSLADRYEHALISRAVALESAQDLRYLENLLNKVDYDRIH